MFTSILEEPSKGSNATTYLLPSISKRIASVSSSDARTAHLWLDFNALINTSFERTSNFFYSSPVLFEPPAIPYKLAIPAFLTLELIYLQAV